jgi:hypothetical protein
MDSDASYGEAGEAFDFGLGTPTGAGMAKKSRAVRRGSERMREETEADEFRVRDPAVFNSAGRVSNAELLRAIVEEFNKAQAEQDAKYDVAIRETRDAHIGQIRDITQKINEKHHEETEKTNKKYQEEIKKKTSECTPEILKTGSRAPEAVRGEQDQGNKRGNAEDGGTANPDVNRRIRQSYHCNH